MPRKKKTPSEETIRVTVHRIDPSKPGSYALARKAFRLWTVVQELFFQIDQGLKLRQAIEGMRNEEKKQKLMEEALNLERRVNEIGLQIFDEIDGFLKDFVDVDGDWDEFVRSLSIDDVKNIVRAVIENPFVFLNMLIPADLISEEEEKDSSQNN